MTILGKDEEVGNKFGLVPDFKAGVLRFPVSALLVLLIALAILLRGPTWLGLLFPGFLFSVIIVFANESFRESYGNDNKQSWSLPVYPIVVALMLPIFLFLAQFFWPAFSFSFMTSTLGLLLLTGLAPFLGKVQNNSAYWQFNHDLWVRAALTLVGCLILSLGISLIDSTVRKLFGFRELFGVRIFSSGFVQFVIILTGGLYWLSVVPKDFTKVAATGKDLEFSSAAVDILVRFILVPLLLVYTVILYLYLASILVQGVLPSNAIGWMVCVYGVIGTFTALLAWPTRFESGPLNAFFWRNWFWLVIGPVVMLAIAIWQRIEAYGLTYDRYYVVLIGLWLTIAAVVFAISRQDRNLKWITAPLAIMLLLSSFGPFGAVGWSNRIQSDRLIAILEKHRLIENGQLITLPDRTVTVSALKNYRTKAYTHPVGREIRSILTYLMKEKALRRLKPLFSGRDYDPFLKYKPDVLASRFSRGNFGLERKIRQLIFVALAEKGIFDKLKSKANPLVQSNKNKFIFNPDSQPIVTLLAPGLSIITPSRFTETEHDFKLKVAGFNKVVLVKKNTNNILLKLDDHLFDFDLSALTTKWRKAKTVSKSHFSHRIRSGNIEVTVHIVALISYHHNDKDKTRLPAIFNVDYFLTVKTLKEAEPI